MVDSDEVNQLFELIDIYVHLSDGRSVRVDIFCNLVLGLEETLQGSLAQRHLFKLSLLVALLLLSLGHEDLLVGAALHGVHHGLEVEELVPERHPSFLERIAPFLNVFGDLHGQILGHRVGKDALRTVAFRVGIDCQVFKGHQVKVDLLVVLMGHVVVDGVFAELFNLFLYLHIGFCQEGRESRNLLLVQHHLACRLVLDNLKV